MSDRVAELRRLARLPSRCRVTVRDRYGFWDAWTEDVSARGCRIVTPRPLSRGTLVSLELTSNRIREPLIVTGQIVWADSARPARAGISFAGSPSGVPGAAPWIEALSASEGGRPPDASAGVTVLGAELDVLVVPPEPVDASPAALARRLADRGAELMRTGHAAAGAMLLRRALTFAPGDPDILALLAEHDPAP